MELTAMVVHAFFGHVSETGIQSWTFRCVFRLLTILTQPIECLLQETHGKVLSESNVPWLQEVSQILAQAKFYCANKAFISAVFTEIRKIFEDVSTDTFSFDLFLCFLEFIHCWQIIITKNNNLICNINSNKYGCWKMTFAEI